MLLSLKHVCRRCFRVQFKVKPVLWSVVVFGGILFVYFKYRRLTITQELAVTRRYQFDYRQVRKTRKMLRPQDFASQRPTAIRDTSSSVEDSKLFTSTRTPMMTTHMSTHRIQKNVESDKMRHNDAVRYSHEYKQSGLPQNSTKMSPPFQAIKRTESVLQNYRRPPIATNTFKHVHTGTLFHNNTKKTRGYDRAQYIQKVCSSAFVKTSVSRRATLAIQMYWNKRYNVSLCNIWKIGSTFWRRVFLIDTNRQFQMHSNPYNIPFNTRLNPTVFQRLSESKAPTFRFMFSRDPYSRLLSAFVDKLLAPNPVYWGIISVKAIRQVRVNPTRLSLKCGHDLTFAEFIKYVIYAFQTGKGIDGHFEKMTVKCDPCRLKYDFIGKMQTFGQDSVEMLEVLGHHAMAHVLTVNGSELAADDALIDTIHQPFFQKPRFVHCISFEEALRRAWRKLQIRGLIGYQSFPSQSVKAGNITHEEFLQLARDARHSSTADERSAIKTEAFDYFFRTVDMEDLNEIRQIYRDDFKLFQYDDSPPSVFDRNNTTRYGRIRNTTIDL